MLLRRLLLALVLLSGVLAADAGPKLAIGTPAPDFKGQDAVTHQPIHLAEQTGKVVVLTFFASWCAPCRNEVPVLVRLQSKVSKDQLVVLAVPFQQPAASYHELVGLFRSWQVALVDDRRGAIAWQYGIKSIPHLFLIGRDGRIAAEHVGYGEGSLEALVADVNAALRGPPEAADAAASTPTGDPSPPEH
jgi:peroxiredoxin